MDVISTAALPAAERFDRWREAITRQFLPLRPERVAGRPFWGAIRAAPMGTLSLSHIHAAGQIIHRSRTEIVGASTDACFLNLQVAGSGGLAYDGHAHRLSPGDLFLVDASHAFRLHVEQPLHQVCVILPAGALRARLMRPELASGVVLLRSPGVAGLLSEYLLAVSRQFDTLPDASASAVAGHVVDLLAHALNERTQQLPQPRQAVRALNYERACAFLRANFADPDLSPEVTARHLRVSTRYLHLLFHERGETPMRVVYRQRLLAAAQALSDAAQTHRTITDIAFACGFRDLSHFGRLFEAEFGASPRPWRSAR